MKEELNNLISEIRKCKSFQEKIDCLVKYRLDHGEEHCASLKAYVQSQRENVQVPVPHYRGTPEKLIKRVDPV